MGGGCVSWRWERGMSWAVQSSGRVCPGQWAGELAGLHSQADMPYAREMRVVRLAAEPQARASVALS